MFTSCRLCSSPPCQQHITKALQREGRGTHWKLPLLPKKTALYKPPVVNTPHWNHQTGTPYVASQAGSKVSNKFRMRSSRKSCSLTVSQQKQSHCFYGTKPMEVLSEPAMSITKVISDNTQGRGGENHSRKESPRTTPSTVTLLTAGKCKGDAVQALPDVGWCHWKEYPVNLQKK